MVKALLRVSAFAFLLALPVAAAGQQAAADRDSLGRAKELYRRDCLVCHGANGDGKTGIATDRELALPDWTDPKSLGGRPDQWLFQVIRNGRGKMPGESAGRADDGEVRDLIRYIRGMARGEAAAPGAAGTPVSPRIDLGNGAAGLL